eukprot:Skav213388  [mRNA]  locus=scaffold797:366422:372108:- [translate_table: standard]
MFDQCWRLFRGVPAILAERCVVRGIRTILGEQLQWWDLCNRPLSRPAPVAMAGFEPWHGSHGMAEPTLSGAAVAEIFAACINGAGETLTLPDLIRWGHSAAHGTARTGIIWQRETSEVHTSTVEGLYTLAGPAPGWSVLTNKLDPSGIFAGTRYYNQDARGSEGLVESAGRYLKIRTTKVVVDAKNRVWGQMHRTATKKAATDPVWDESFVLEMQHGSGSRGGS